MFFYLFLSDISAFLLFTSKDSIRRISMDTDDMSDVHLDIVNIENAVSIDFDFQTRRIFYSDVNVDKIFSADFDGGNLRVVVGHNLVNADGIAVDWVAKNLYFTDTGRNVIEVCRLNGTSCSICFTFFVAKSDFLFHKRHFAQNYCGFGFGRATCAGSSPGEWFDVLD